MSLLTIATSFCGKPRVRGEGLPAEAHATSCAQRSPFFFLHLRVLWHAQTRVDARKALGGNLNLYRRCVSRPPACCRSVETSNLSLDPAWRSGTYSHHEMPPHTV